MIKERKEQIGVRLPNNGKTKAENELFFFFFPGGRENEKITREVRKEWRE